MPAGLFSIDHNLVNEKQCSQKDFKAFLSAGFFHSKPKFSTPIILESGLFKNKKRVINIYICI